MNLYRRGRLSDAELDTQMDEIGKEETGLEAQIAELRGQIAAAESIGTTILSAEALLSQLRNRLDEPISWDSKRRLIEILVAGIRVDTVEEHGVKQAKISVTYRFSQPDQPLPLVLPKSYAAGSEVRIPVELRTLGDHIRKRRLELRLLQREAAERLGVNKTSIANWESNRGQPEVRYMPAIIDFLGYDPLPPAESWGAHLVGRRTTLGLTQKEAATHIGVDQGTLARWERGEREPAGAYLPLARAFIEMRTDRCPNPQKHPSRLVTEDARELAGSSPA